MAEKQDTDSKGSPPETPGGFSNSREDLTERPKKARRTFLTQNACTRCRQKKSKCDGKRPVCGRCEKHGAECLYDVAQEGITRMQNLQQQLEIKTAEHAKMMSLVNALQHSTDYEATTLLARLRLGASTDDLLSFAGATQASSSGAQEGSSGSQNHPPPGYMRSWPPSPLDEGSWTSWSTRCDPSGRPMPHSLDQQMDPFRGGARFAPHDIGMQNRQGYQQNDPRDGYYQTIQRERYPGSQHSITLEPSQWPNPHPQEGDTTPRITSPAVRYFGDSEQASEGYMQQGHPSYQGGGGSGRRRDPTQGSNFDGQQ